MKPVEELRLPINYDGWAADELVQLPFRGEQLRALDRCLRIAFKKGAVIISQENDSRARSDVLDDIVDDSLNGVRGYEVDPNVVGLRVLMNQAAQRGHQWDEQGRPEMMEIDS